MKRPGRLAAAVGGAMTGFVAEYLLDPDRGRSRRSRLGDQARAIPRRFVRKASARTRAQGRYAAGVAHGVAHRLTHLRAPLPENDATLAQKVRSEVLGSEPFAGHAIVVTAVDGAVTLRGQLPNPSHITRLDQQVRKVAGVRHVENLVHSPGAPAPNKQGPRSAG